MGEPMLNAPIAIGMVRPERCEKCAFVAPVKGQENSECRFNPPTATHFMVKDAHGRPMYVTCTGYPLVNPTNWCGHFKPKIAI